MKFTTDAKLFTAELDTVRRIINLKSTIPITQTVRIDVVGAGFTLTGTNLDQTLITHKLTGRFPNYEIVMPKDNDKLASFDIATMKDAVKRAKAATDKRNNAVSIHFKANEAILSTTNDDCVRTEAVEIDYASDEIELGFNATYLLEYLTAVKTGKGILSFKGQNNPVAFTIEGYDYDYKYVLMPIRI